MSEGKKMKSLIGVFRKLKVPLITGSNFKNLSTSKEDLAKLWRPHAEVRCFLVSYVLRFPFTW